jgi:hypothetical protein
LSIEGAEGPISVRAVGADEVKRLVRQMNSPGHACVANFIPETELSTARAFVMRELERHGLTSFAFHGPAAAASEFMRRLGASDEFRDLLVRIYEAGTGRTGPSTPPFQNLRVVAGHAGLRQAHLFHYDAYVVTALVPIIIPDAPGEQRGDLVLYPKLRAVRGSVVTNLVEKALWQNPLARRVARSRVTSRLLGAETVRMTPGNLYLFWGYQSLHGNQRIDPESVRATALFHYADPHEESPLLAAVQRLRSWRERRVRERTAARPSMIGPPW